MRNYTVRIVDQYGNCISEVWSQGYGPAHAMDEAITCGGLFIPVGFMGFAYVVNEIGVAYKFEIGAADWCARYY